MKKLLFIFNIIITFTLSLCMISCDDSDDKTTPEEEEEGGDDEEKKEKGDDNPSEIPDERNLTIQMKKLEPGIYEVTEDDVKMMLARSKDNWFWICIDLDSYANGPTTKTSNYLPSDLMWTDGKSWYQINQEWIDWDRDANWITKDYEAEFSLVQNECATKEAFLESLIAQSYASTIYTVFYLNEILPGCNKIEKVGDAGENHTDTYNEIIKLYAKGEVPATSSMLQEYTGNGLGWLTGKYPSAMESAKYVIPYTKEGTVTSMSIIRGHTTPDEVKYLYSCQIDKIHEIQVEISDVSEADAKEYIQKIKDEGRYIRILADKEESNIIMFEADHWYEEGGPDLPDGVSHYYTPQYKVMYDIKSKTLYITLSVVKTIIV